MLIYCSAISTNPLLIDISNSNKPKRSSERRVKEKPKGRTREESKTGRGVMFFNQWMYSDILAVNRKPVKPGQMFLVGVLYACV
jgi:hypothetical protein